MVENAEKWGRKTARERYGKLDDPSMKPALWDAEKPQRLGDETNLQGPKYDDDQANNWVRGGPNESAESKPSFDKGPVHGKRA